MKQVEHILAEASILAAIRHPFIVNMLKTFQVRVPIYIRGSRHIVEVHLFRHAARSTSLPTDSIRSTIRPLKISVCSYVLHGLSGHTLPVTWLKGHLLEST